MGYMQVVQASMEAPVEVRELLPPCKLRFMGVANYFHGSYIITFHENGSKVPENSFLFGVHGSSASFHGEAPVEVREPLPPCVTFSGNSELLPRKLYDYFFYESGSKVPKK